MRMWACRFVEKRLLEDHIAKLSDEVTSRDALDAEIQTCVAGLFERTRTLEAENDVLRAELGRLGVDAEALLLRNHGAALQGSGQVEGQGARAKGAAMQTGAHEPDVLVVE